jgi:hypothetical protein
LHSSSSSSSWAQRVPPAKFQTSAIHPWPLLFVWMWLDHNPLKDPGVPHFAFDMFRKALDNVVYTFCCFIIFELTGQKLLNFDWFFYSGQDWINKFFTIEFHTNSEVKPTWIRNSMEMGELYSSRFNILGSATQRPTNHNPKYFCDKEGGMKKSHWWSINQVD